MVKPKYILIASKCVIDTNDNTGQWYSTTKPNEWVVIKKAAGKGSTPYIPIVVGFTPFL